MLEYKLVTNESTRIGNFRKNDAEITNLFRLVLAVNIPGASIYNFKAFHIFSIKALWKPATEADSTRQVLLQGNELLAGCHFTSTFFIAQTTNYTVATDFIVGMDSSYKHEAQFPMSIKLLFPCVSNEWVAPNVCQRSKISRERRQSSVAGVVIFQKKKDRHSRPINDGHPSTVRRPQSWPWRWTKTIQRSIAAPLSLFSCVPAFNLNN